jgi:hypothetical protein
MYMVISFDMDDGGIRSSAFFSSSTASVSKSITKACLAPVSIGPSGVRAGEDGGAPPPAPCEPPCRPPPPRCRAPCASAGSGGSSAEASIAPVGRSNERRRRCKGDMPERTPGRIRSIGYYYLRLRLKLRQQAVQ